MIGYRFSLHHNDAYAFRDYPALTRNQRIHQELVPDMSGKPLVGPRRCPECHCLIAKWDEPLPALKIKKRSYAISTTYDGIVIASQEFKDACEKNCLIGLLFRQLPADPGFYQILATKVVSFDFERRKTRFLKQCDTCGRNYGVLGMTPAFLKPGTVIEGREFVRSDLEFGEGDAKRPALYCGVEAGQILQEANLQGIDLSPISD